ncbi:MAG: flagellar assembly protein FliX [Alphaproteobacteria bacterium]|nr:flagellar assembly protein FliX [Alphaproteobacteria bacterium]
MKVGETKGSGGTAKSKKASSAQAGSSADFSQYVHGGASETSGAQATQSIAQLDALLAAQEIEDPAQRSARKRAYVRADTILDKLEEVRIKMLGGNLTVGHMIDVADVVAFHRDKIDDPKLTAIMDEIDLRAQVEIAKLRVALDQASL